MKILPHLSTDGYKIGHGSMYSEGTQLVYSNLTLAPIRFIGRRMPPTSMTALLSGSAGAQLGWRS